MNKGQTATIFGGTGFAGRRIVAELAKRGLTVKIATRVPERAYFLKTCGVPGQIVPLACDYNDPASIANAVRGSDYVVNCVGILFERRKGDFVRAHADIPRNIAQACARHGVAGLVHLSALGADRGLSRYAHTKLEGESAVRAAFPAAVILRPGVMFGPGDSFFNMFAELARYTPALPLIGGGKTALQPVYAGDVATAAVAALETPGAAGKTYELGGPEIVTFREVYERLAVLTGRRRCLVGVPFALAKIEAAVLNLLPRPLLTPDQVESLKTDSVVTPGALTLGSLGIAPTPMGAILPGQLARYRPGGREFAKTAGI